MKGLPPISAFWGKLRRANPGDLTSPVVEWHPLIDHCADVAACLVALLGLCPEAFKPTVLNQRLAKLGGRETLDKTQVMRLGVIAALHDIGKFNHGFQNKAPGRESRVLAGHVGPAAMSLPCPLERLLDDPGKCHISVMRLLPPDAQSWTVEPLGVFRFLLAAWAHHGQPVATGGLVNDELWKAQNNRNPFGGIKALLKATRAWLPQAWTPGGEPLPQAPAFQHAFAGLVQLADWLGSDEDRFPYSDGVSERWPIALAAAQETLRTLAIVPEPLRANMPLPRAESILSDRPPRPMQDMIAQMPLPEVGPSIVLIEDETGADKTEAALIWFARLFAAGLVDGLYFALPTRTAATQIHNRVCQAVAALWPREPRPAVVLAVPGYLRVDEEEGQRLPGFEVLWPDQQLDPSRWAAEHPKRYMAGCVVVGTVDQALLSALAVSHSHLRAACLLRHLLVVDEVHASDAYMTTILERVLAHHCDAGGHALLMSATLGAQARGRLLHAPVPDLETARKVPYPLITTDGARSVIPVASWAGPRRIRLSVRPCLDDPVAIAGLAHEAASQGARVLLIRNTVRGCLAVFDALAAISPDLRWRCQSIPAPHHSRFAREDRQALDRALEQSFGPGAACGPRPSDCGLYSPASASGPCLARVPCTIGSHGLPQGCLHYI